MKLGKIKKIDLRDIWASESYDFTPWLAKEENIALLGDAIGIDLEVESQEQSVGPFRADILARDLATNHYVLIENQLELTNHNHLGQIMTYAAGLDAFSIIWIAKAFTEEHRAALDWLNRITDENINFFGIEIQVIQIGDSMPAAQFNVVAKPNDWSKSVKSSANSGELTDTKIKQQAYWTDFKEYVLQNGAPFKVQKPLPQHWTNIAIGKSYYNLSLTINSVNNVICINLEITGENAKKNFDSLKADFEEESKEKISPKLEWLRMD
ncbi:MAG: DUF4268 domain-containing protein, partial [bacterium]|nr:DUF4268 domain-containing protein [bacterium]